MSTTTDTLFAPLTIATAPEASRPVLDSIQQSFRFIPNLIASFANNPVVLQGYLALDTAYENGSFTQRERQINALVTLVKELVRERGYAKDIQKFLAAGYKKEQVMELLLGIALKTISNYVDHISPTPVTQLPAKLQRSKLLTANLDKRGAQL